MSVLVTGGVGYIGSHTAIELIEAGRDVVIVDNLSNSNIIVLDRIEELTGVRPKFYQLDVQDREKLEIVFKKII
ncbi:short chain dehydrogenase family protein [[Clostridium] sordellii ATCC 9714]|nr:short chain dehydrogenase family protein [[Clostridium] sordellii ATCC 9714] [Paeniclostridium sordellii ATCC 9714]